MISAIVLAAGLSRRMGSPKQEATLGSMTMLERVVRTYVRSRAGEVAVVVQPRHVPLLPVARKLRLVLNKNPERGMSFSLRLGLDSIRGEAAIIGLGDQPLLKTSTLNTLVDTYTAHGSRIVIPTFGGRRGNPVLFHRSLFGEIRQIRGDRGAKSIIQANEAEVMEVEVKDPGILVDVDVPLELKKVRRALQALRKGESRNKHHPYPASPR